MTPRRREPQHELSPISMRSARLTPTGGAELRVAASGAELLWRMEAELLRRMEGASQFGVAWQLRAAIERGNQVRQFSAARGGSAN